MRFIRSADALKRGDKVISSGLGGVFPRGLAVGEIREVVSEPGLLESRILVRPGVDLRTVSDLLIVTSAP